MRRYLQLSRTRSYSFLFALPLLLAYEVGAAWLNARPAGTGLRNGADVLLRSLLAAGGVSGTLPFAGVLVILAGAAIVAERRRSRVPLETRVFAGMLGESAVLGGIFGVVIGTATYWILGGLLPRLAADQALGGVSLPEGVVLSLGAGVYEELVFRVLLVGGLLAILRAAGMRRSRAGPAAAVLAALAFSAFHYLGPYGDAWALASFAFRFVAGLAFSGLYLARGFGITAWTHALYDIFLLVGMGP